jgi:RNA polymerase sigma factor (sigma-70 family)
MPSADDSVLLRQFAENRSDEAFTDLVERHLNLVYSIALRQAGDPHEAQEIAQAVFIILARKAGSLRNDKALASWLFQTTRLTANNFIRSGIRRHRREQEAYMQSLLNEPTDETWQRIAPMLDAAVGALGEKDRRAVLLRFYEGRNLRDVGAILGASEDAAEKRVARALDKLRKTFAKHGVDSTTAAIAGTISANFTQAAPAGLAKTISSVAIAKSAAASTSAITLAKGALKIMAWTKTKTAIVAGAALLLTAGTATVVKIYYFPTIKDSYFQANYQHFQKLPGGLFTLRPTHFHTPADGLDYSCEASGPTGEHLTWMMGRNRTFQQLITRLYNCATWQVVWPPDVPKYKFDYLYTMLDTKTERFDTAIKKLGYVASWQEPETEVYLLRVVTPGSSALKANSSAKDPGEKWTSEDQLEFRGRWLGSLANEIQDLANVPVIDQTGDPTAYDFDFNCPKSDVTDQNWDSISHSLARLGLQLVPTNMPVRMLVVEKTK